MGDLFAMSSKASIGFVMFLAGAAFLALTAFQINNPASVSAQFVQINSATAGSVSAPAQNTSKVYAFVAPATVSTSVISLACNTADNSSNAYDIGIYDSSGTLVVHSGLTAGTTLFAATGIRNISWLTSGTLAGGQRYYLAWSTNAASPAAVLGGTNAFSPAIGAAGPTPSSGVLVTGAMPADSWALSTFPTFVLR
jgi:hypothetical protein